MMCVRWLARVLLLGGVCTFAAASAEAKDWIFDYGQYTANPKTGHRVDQYAKIKAPHRVPYYNYFSPDGPSPYIPYSYYQDTLGPMNGYFGGGGGGEYGYGYGTGTGGSYPFGTANGYGF